MNSLEYLVEQAAINELEEHIPDVTWLHFEHNHTGGGECPLGIVKLERGEQTTDCFHLSELSLFIVGACDEIHRRVDETLGNPDALATQLERIGGIAIGKVAGWIVSRATTENNLYSRTWSNELEAGYYTNN